jgi:hypothetical protein
MSQVEKTAFEEIESAVMLVVGEDLVRNTRKISPCPFYDDDFFSPQYPVELQVREVFGVPLPLWDGHPGEAFLLR